MSRQLAIGIVAGFLFAVGVLAWLETRGGDPASPPPPVEPVAQPNERPLRRLPFQPPKAPFTRPLRISPPTRDEMRGVRTEAANEREGATVRQPLLVPLQPTDGGAS